MTRTGQAARHALEQLVRDRHVRLRAIGRRRCSAGVWERRLTPAPGLTWTDVAPSRRHRVAWAIFGLLDAGALELWEGDDGEFRLYPARQAARVSRDAEAA